MLEFHELSPSPNNLKIHLALRFKGIPFDSIPVDPHNRSGLVRLSGQELTPVIADRGIVLNDSEAILQYLDANYPGTKRLFPADRAGRRACDQWKQALDDRVLPGWLPVFLHGIGRRKDLDEKARSAFHACLKELDRELGTRSSFHGTERPVCDLRVAMWILYALPGPKLLERVGLFRRFAEHYAVVPGDLPNLVRFAKAWDI